MKIEEKNNFTIMRKVIIKGILEVLHCTALNAGFAQLRYSNELFFFFCSKPWIRILQSLWNKYKHICKLINSGPSTWMALYIWAGLNRHCSTNLWGKFAAKNYWGFILCSAHLWSYSDLTLQNYRAMQTLPPQKDLTSGRKITKVI